MNVRNNTSVFWRRRLPLLYAVSVVLIYLLSEFVAERTWITTLFAYAPPLLFVVPALPLALISLLAALWRRDKRALAIQAAIALFCLFFLLGFRLPLPNLVRRGETLRVLAFNIAHGDEGTNSIAAVVRQVGPDVISFEEINGYGGGRDPLPELERALPEYRFVRAADVAIASRLPLRSVRLHPLITGSAYRVAVEATVDFHGESVTIVGVHLATAATPESLTSGGIRAIPGYLRRTTAVRTRQIATLQAALRSVKPPLIVCGDFNTPPCGLLYRRLTAAYQDAFARRGVGVGWTYPASFPVLRIDYIFTANGAEAVNAFVPNVRASDHRPIVSDIALRAANL